MNVIGPVVFALFGLAFGSFLNVVIYRLPRKLSVVSPPSACPQCDAPIRPWDNVPVVSYLILRGRCRNCGEPISVEYPLVEAGTAALFAAAAVRFPNGVAVLVAPFLGVMLAAAMIDLRHRIIPNRLVYPSLVLFALAIVVAWAAGVDVNPVRALLGLLAYGGALFIVALISPAGMGMGDVKLAALIGMMLGSLGWKYVVVGAVSGMLLGGAGAVVALLLGRSRKDTIPFGPFLAAGAVVAALLAGPIATWYGGRLG
jgi:leader peptidase (prepilin peptidase)/N-methyltransferase